MMLWGIWRGTTTKLLKWIFTYCTTNNNKEQQSLTYLYHKWHKSLRAALAFDHRYIFESGLLRISISHAGNCDYIFHGNNHLKDFLSFPVSRGTLNAFFPLAKWNVAHSFWLKFNASTMRLPAYYGGHDGAEWTTPMAGGAMQGEADSCLLCDRAALLFLI